MRRMIMRNNVLDSVTCAAIGRLTSDCCGPGQDSAALPAPRRQARNQRQPSSRDAVRALPSQALAGNGGGFSFGGRGPEERGRPARGGGCVASSRNRDRSRRCFPVDWAAGQTIGGSHRPSFHQKREAAERDDADDDHVTTTLAATAPEGILPSDVRQWPRVLARYRDPDAARSLSEIAVTVLPLIALWVAMWGALQISPWLCPAARDSRSRLHGPAVHDPARLQPRGVLPAPGDQRLGRPRHRRGDAHPARPVAADARDPSRRDGQSRRARDRRRHHHDGRRISEPRPVAAALVPDLPPSGDAVRRRPDLPLPAPAPAADRPDAEGLGALGQHDGHQSRHRRDRDRAWCGCSASRRFS